MADVGSFGHLAQTAHAMTPDLIGILGPGDAVRCTYLSALCLAAVSKPFQGFRSHDIAMAALLTDVWTLLPLCFLRGSTQLRSDRRED